MCDEIGLTRRRFVGLLAGSSGLLAVGAARVAAGALDPPSRMIGPHSPLVAAAEKRRFWSGRTVAATLIPSLTTIDLAGRTADTWAFDHAVPGPLLRAAAGDELAVTVFNGLPASTTVHWHGIAIRNDMDGVPLTMADYTSGPSPVYGPAGSSGASYPRAASMAGMAGMGATATPGTGAAAPMPGGTEAAISPDGTFEYRFRVDQPGTYWYHSHVGVQRDRGLYGPLIVDDPNEAGDYDQEVIVVLDDWVDGLGYTPDQVLARLIAGVDTGVTAMSMDPASPWGPMLGDVQYPFHLVNGRPEADPEVWQAAPGDRIRLRIINAGADTDYRVALSGHRLTVTHADGWAVQPVTVDQLLIGKAERYDAIVTAGDGVFALVAEAEGKGAAGRALLRTGAGQVPPIGLRPPQMSGRLLGYGDLVPAPGTALPVRRPDREVTLLLGRDPTVPYRWTINGRAAPDVEPVAIHPGERLRITYMNVTDMAHPMHLHGHTFALVATGARKDTAVVPPGWQLSIDVEGDNPGQWMLHCHDEYHMNAGMMTALSYRT